MASSRCGERLFFARYWSGINFVRVLLVAKKTWVLREMGAEGGGIEDVKKGVVVVLVVAKKT